MEVEILPLLPVKVIDSCGLDLQPGELPDLKTCSRETRRALPLRAETLSLGMEDQTACLLQTQEWESLQQLS